MTRQPLPDKWFSGLHADASVCDAAECVLTHRVQAVVKQLKAVVKSRGENDEAVHQVRVASRRVQAALLAFKPWLRRERRKRTSKALRRLRDAAGSVRTCDVHRVLLRETISTVEPDDHIALEAALMMVDLERRTALNALQREARRTRRALDRPKGRWTRRSGAASNGQSMPTLAGAGATSLKSLAAAFVELGDGDVASREDLHRLRVQGKKLRYAIEIFGATAGQSDFLVALSQALTSLQDRLGLINDYHEVAERLARHAAKADADASEDATPEGDKPATSSLLYPHLESLADRFEGRCNSAVADFEAWWQGDEARAFRHTLEGIAGRSCPNADVEPEPPAVVVLAHTSQVQAEAETEPAHVSAACAAGDER